MRIPSLKGFDDTACAMATIGILVSTPAAAIVPKSLVPLGTSAFAIPLCFNFIVTGLIIGRIWWKGRSCHGNIGRAGGVVMLPPTYLKAATVVVIESGLVYLVVQFVLTVLFAINHPAQIMLADIATQIYVRPNSHLLVGMTMLTLIVPGYRTNNDLRASRIGRLDAR